MSEDIATEYLSPAAVAARLGKSENALAQMRHRGNGPPYVIFHSRSIRYPKRELDAWLAALPRHRSTHERATLLSV